MSTAAAWHLDLTPPRALPVTALALTWLVFGPLIAWSLVTHQGVLFTAMCAAFPVVITYYALQSALGGAGHVRIDRDGFTVRRPGAGQRHFAWRDVRAFYIAPFASSALYDGHAAAHFDVTNAAGHTQVEWLPGNLGLAPAQLVHVMERLRLLAQDNWPTQPARLQDILDV